jgi:hypothetical protein
MKRKVYSERDDILTKAGGGNASLDEAGRLNRQSYSFATYSTYKIEKKRKRKKEIFSSRFLDKETTF